ncbi:hypothetical protein ABK040_007780 [Willaertia magna]
MHLKSKEEQSNEVKMEKKEVPKTLNSKQGFIYGGLAGMMATSIIQPLDLVKTRMQLSGEKANPVRVFFDVASKEGPFKLYSGLTAALLRQATYTTTRMGVFNALSEYMTTTDPVTGKRSQPNFLTKIGIGMLSGAAGAVVGNPAEVALIRMTSGKYRGAYNNVVDALVKITKDEGVLRLWRGCYPTVVRAVVLNAAQLSVYAQTKELFLKNNIMRDGIGLHSVSSIAAGFVCTIASLPVDFVKTKMQTMKVDPATGQPEFKGSLDVISKAIKKDGPFVLWRGFWPYFFRIGPHTILTFLFLEQFRLYFGK